jgi:DNA polymerase-1
MYRQIKPWQMETIQFAREHGYTQTAYGNRRHLGNSILSSDDSVRTRLERQAVNHVIQGCAADILKCTMAEIHRSKLMTRTKSFLIAPVYDELATSVPRAAVVDYCLELKDIMAITPPGHAVPMVAEFAVSADSWGRVVEIGSDPSEQLINQVFEEGAKEEAAA